VEWGIVAAITAWHHQWANMKSFWMPKSSWNTLKMFFSALSPRTRFQSLDWGSCMAIWLCPVDLGSCSSSAPLNPARDVEAASWFQPVLLYLQRPLFLLPRGYRKVSMLATPVLLWLSNWINHDYKDLELFQIKSRMKSDLVNIPVTFPSSSTRMAG